MDAAHPISELDGKGLREFGLVTGAIVAGLFGVFFPWMLERAFPLWPWVVLGVLGAWALVAPNSLRPVYVVWMRLGLLLNKIMTPIVMAAIFFLIFAPIALVMRIAKRDPMRRKFDRNVVSYRVDSQHPPKESLEKPF